MGELREKLPGANLSLEVVKCHSSFSVRPLTPILSRKGKTGSCQEARGPWRDMCFFSCIVWAGCHKELDTVWPTRKQILLLFLYILKHSVFLIMSSMEHNGSHLSLLFHHNDLVRQARLLRPKISSELPSKVEIWTQVSCILVIIFKHFELQLWGKCRNEPSQSMNKTKNYTSSSKIFEMSNLICECSSGRITCSLKYKRGHRILLRMSAGVTLSAYISVVKCHELKTISICIWCHIVKWCAKAN